MKLIATVFVFLCLASYAREADAAGVRVFTVRAGATVLENIKPEFERTTGHRLEIVYDPVLGGFAKRIAAGEPFDIYISSPAAVDALIKDGKIVAATRTNFARSGMGVEVRAGAPKPDVSSVDAFKRALLAAKSVGYITPNGVQDVLARLGLNAALQPKVTTPTSDVVSELVAKGDLELGIVVTTQIVTTPGVALAGPLPPELQYDFQFTGGISSRSGAPDAARDLLKFLASPYSIMVIRSQGMEPG